MARVVLLASFERSMNRRLPATTRSSEDRDKPRLVVKSVRSASPLATARSEPWTSVALTSLEAVGSPAHGVKHDEPFLQLSPQLV